MEKIFCRTGMVGESQVSTQDLIKFCLNNPPEGGSFQYKDYKDRARVENAMDKVTTDADERSGNGSTDLYFELEDSDYKNLVRYVRDMKWGVRSPFILEFCDQFLSKRQND